MATLASIPIEPARERRFYMRMAWLIAALVFIGFAPSFYLKFTGLSFPRPNPVLLPSMMVHGLFMTAWIAVFFAQVSLVSAGRRDLHRQLGAAGMLLGVALVPVMYLTAVWGVAHANNPPFTDALTWSAVPLVGIPVFIILLWLGWRESRRDLQAHKRLMLGLMIMMTDPAIGRLPLAPPNLVGFAALAVLAWLLLVPLFVWDRRTQGGLHWATRTVAALYALVLVLQVAFLATPGVWSAFAVNLPGVAG